MIVVSNTSPLTNLAAVGQFALLEQLYGELHIADAVWGELNAAGKVWPSRNEVANSLWIEIERFRPENRLTSPQMAKRLGISRSQMVARIQAKTIEPMPVSGPGIDDCKHYLFLIDGANSGM